MQLPKGRGQELSEQLQGWPPLQLYATFGLALQLLCVAEAQTYECRTEGPRLGHAEYCRREEATEEAKQHAYDMKEFLVQCGLEKAVAEWLELI